MYFGCLIDKVGRFLSSRVWHFYALFIFSQPYPTKERLPLINWVEIWLYKSLGYHFLFSILCCHQMWKILRLDVCEILDVALVAINGSGPCTLDLFGLGQENQWLHAVPEQSLAWPARIVSLTQRTLETMPWRCFRVAGATSYFVQGWWFHHTFVLCPFVGLHHGLVEPKWFLHTVCPPSSQKKTQQLGLPMEPHHLLRWDHPRKCLGKGPKEGVGYPDAAHGGQLHYIMLCSELESKAPITGHHCNQCWDDLMRRATCAVLGCQIGSQHARISYVRVSTRRCNCLSYMHMGMCQN